MEHASLIVLTLLQLCRAEISEIIPGTWFSANAINDGYSPKPILELFSTEPAHEFSPTKPIVVLPSYSPPQPDLEVTYLSTPAPDYPSSSTPLPPTSSHSPFSASYPTSSTPFPPTVSPTYETSTPIYDLTSPTYETSTASYGPSSSPFPPSNTLYAKASTSFSDPETISTPFPPPTNLPVFDFPNGEQPASRPRQTTLTVLRDPKGYELMEPISTLPPVFIPETQTTPNFLVVYENTPPPPPIRPQPGLPIIASSSPPPLIPTVLTTKTLPPQTIPSDTITPYITNTFSDGTSRPTITFRSTPPTITSVTASKTSFFPSSELSSPFPPNFTLKPKDNRAPQIYAGPPKANFVPNLKIRIVAPKGSITNVKINPTTTTKRPTTRRPKKNTHEYCVDNCKGRREHICAVPLGTLIVEPNMLKGFPSICHMACHNSYKKEPYEKIVDGRCGKVRTRIIRVDSKTKVHREELKKAEYSIINTGPKAIVELAGGDLYSRKRRHGAA